ncbi:MAG: AAA family ATPase [Sedimentisphaerales bacterium]|nr:AAA family ATPase [Sedimentisphaerales bacterium]
MIESMQSMRVESVHLARFKGFQDFRMDCSHFTALVGLNNGGKTSILQAIRLVMDIFMFAFGRYANKDAEKPDFANPQWVSNPTIAVNRMVYADPESLWLRKMTSEPCKVTLCFSENVKLDIEIAGRAKYTLDMSVNGESIKGKVLDEEDKDLIKKLFALRPEYLSPAAGISPIEPFMNYQELSQRLDKGAMAECWRSNLYWLCNDGNMEDFEEVDNIVKRYLPGALIHQPTLSHDSPPQVRVNFEEDEINFDIGSSGGGLRTVFSVAAVLHFSRSRCLLFDEPDAHLHPALQRQVASMLLDHAIENDVQILAATHAPDFIADVPVEHLVWIDRTQKEAARCDGLGRVLTDLGVLSKDEALRRHGASKILFIEGKLDRKILSALSAAACTSDPDLENPFDDNGVIVAELPNGKGDSAHLKSFQSLVQNSFGLQIRVACILDNDYGLSGNTSQPFCKGEPLVEALERKEIENYLLEPEVVKKAIVDVLQERTNRGDPSAEPPSTELVEQELQKILETPEIMESVKYQLRPKYRETLQAEGDASTRERNADEWFESKWCDSQWKLNNCPGKEVLKRLREWCRQKFRVTLTDTRLIEELGEPPEDVCKLLKKVCAHLKG